MNCPSCQTPFHPESYQGINLLVCNACKGVWLGQSELEEISKNRNKRFKTSQVEALNRLCRVNGKPKQQESRELPCPQCQSIPLNTEKHHYSSDILVDRCEKGCGIWLEADELEKIQIHAEIWQDKLEANRDQFSLLSDQIEEDTLNQSEALSQTAEPSHFKFIQSVNRGLIKFG